MLRFKRLLVTGGAGFIGSAFVRRSLDLFPDLEILVTLDLLTYAGTEESLPSHPKHHFVQGDICNIKLVETLCKEHKIEAIVHFAAESHVDTSIEHPARFIQTNITGTFSLLEVVRKFPHIHFHHISTDEVYGSSETGLFNEHSPYLPNSPYSASKAASDHLVRAWGHTYALSTTLSHCTNNYGPYQHAEKFIPRMILSALRGVQLPIYGDGKNIRDWLYVDDHVDALWFILNRGKRGEVYDVGGSCEWRNVDLLHTLIRLVAEKIGENVSALEKLITFVPDRPGHDFRYAIDSTKICHELGWKPAHSLEQGLAKTVDWYVNRIYMLAREGSVIVPEDTKGS